MDSSLVTSARIARDAIKAGVLKGSAFLKRLREVPRFDRDLWLDEALGLGPVPADAEGLPRDSVPYLPSEVDALLKLVGEAPVRRGDVFVDLGAGVGRAVLLVHLITGARAVGIEIQAPLVETARARSEALGLSNLTFVHANAAEVELDGSVFFLYCPFGGETLNQVVQRLHRLSQRRRIVIGALGFEIQSAPWLVARATGSVDLTLYESSSNA